MSSTGFCFVLLCFALLNDLGDDIAPEIPRRFVVVRADHEAAGPQRGNLLGGGGDGQARRAHQHQQVRVAVDSRLHRGQGKATSAKERAVRRRLGKEEGGAIAVSPWS